MEQHDLPLPHALAGDQRRAVGQVGNDRFGQIGAGLRHDLRADADVIGDVQAEKRRTVAEGGQRFRLAADRPATAAQAHGHQWVNCVAADVAGGHMRSGKAQQQAALFDPVGQFGRFVVCHRGHIGQHDHIGVGRQHIIQRTVQQVGGGGQRLLQVVQR